MNILFVNACIRGAASRTEKIAQTFLDALLLQYPTALLETVDLNVLRPAPLFGDTLAEREQAAAQNNWKHPCFALARQFQRADLVLIAAPFWEGTFPAALHTYIEHICVVGLTFRYQKSGAPMGLCSAGRAVFCTTKGGIYSTEAMQENDFAARFLRTNLQMLGIPLMDIIEAEGLDIVGADVSTIVHEAEQKALALAETI